MKLLKNMTILGVSCLFVAPITIVTSCSSNGDKHKDNLEQDYKKIFEEEIKKTSFTKPEVFEDTIDIVSENDSEIEEKIKQLLIKRWSGSSNPINVNKSNSEYVVTINEKTNTYCKNIFKKIWADILKESENSDIQKINQVIYAFRLNKKSDNKWEIIPTYVQFSFTEKASWLENQSSYRHSLISAKELVSTINIQNTQSKN